MNQTRETGKKLQFLFITGILLAVLVSGALLAPITVFPEPLPGPIGDVIENLPFIIAPPAGSLLNVDWDIRDHPGYDIAYEEGLSEFFNDGNKTPNHVVRKDDQISFYGYDSTGHLDFVFTEDYDKNSGSSFVMYPWNMNFHTFSETGYLFNGTMTESGSNVYYTGYAVILQCGNTAGMQEFDETAPNTAALRVYYIKNELWDTNNFSPGNALTTRTLIATVKTNISNFDDTKYSTDVEIDPLNRAFRVFVDGVLQVEVSEAQLLGNGGTGFGFYTGYYSHGCSILTRIRYEEVTVNAEATPAKTNAKVYFMEEGTDIEIRAAETETGWTNQKYKIIQPRKLITDDGDIYYLSSNDRGMPVLKDMQLRYRTNEDDNVTILYYVKYVPGGQDPTILEKNARVNEGDWENGEENNPVTVVTGDEIEYSIIYEPPPVRAMISRGSSKREDDDDDDYNRLWWNQPYANSELFIWESQVKTVTFVNFSENINSEIIFFDVFGNKWDGKDIEKIWDATEYDSCNLHSSTHKVFVWATESDTTGYNKMYDIYVGGYGGIQLSAAAKASNQFSGFSSLESIENIALLFTEKAVNMDGMFNGCQTLSQLDLSGFETKNVTNMSWMFSFCNSLTDLDLSGFDTTNVTDMSYMFYNCRVLADLNLSSFDTNNVTNMSYMFSFCPSLQTLKLNHFDMSQVLYASEMFQGCSTLKTLDLSWWDLGSAMPANAIQIYSMFSGCSDLGELHLESAVLKDVTQHSNIFTGASSLLEIFVGSNDMKDWIENLPSWPPGLEAEIRDPIDPRPEPATPAGKMVKITDTIPDGLIINEGSITGEESDDPIKDKITWSRSGQTITWLVPANMLPADLTVIVTVESGLSDKTKFKNQAVVNGTEPTNTTYHEYTGQYRVTEQYLLYDGIANDIELDDSLETLLDVDDSYFVSGLNPNIIKTYLLIFYGYEREGLDSTIILSDPPPSPAYDPGKHRDDFDTNHNEVIRLYYKQVTVTIHYVNELGIPIKSADTVAIIPGKDYYLPTWYLNNFTYSGSQWTYYDYAKNPDDSIKDIDPLSALGTEPLVGDSPIYPDNTVPAFSCGVDDPMTGDKHITLYFTTAPAAVVRFVELDNPTHVLHVNETYFTAPTFIPALALRSGGDKLEDDIDLTAISDKIYQFAGKYSIDAGNPVTGSPGELETSCLITLYFKTNYTLTEKFHSKHDGHYAIPLQPDITHVLESGDTFTGNPPATINYGGLVWHYVGFKTDSDDNPLISGSPTDEIMIEGFFGDITIIYVYEPDRDIFVVNFEGNGGTVLPENSKRIIIPPDSNLGSNMPPNPTRSGYNFTGWNTKKDGSDTPFTSLTEVINNITVYAQWTPITGGPGGSGGTVTPPTPNYGLKVEKELASGQPSMVYPGDEVHYLIRVTNTGDTALKGVKVTDVIGGKTYDVATISELLPNEFKEFAFTYPVPQDAQPGSIIRNTAAAEHSATGTSYADVFVSMFIRDHIWYIRGYEDNTLRPGNNITRAELAMVFFRLLNPALKNIVPKAPFTDVKGHEWYGLGINLLAYYDILTGYTDGSFRPNQPVSRREMAAVVSRFDLLLETNDNPYSDLRANDWAYSYILSATKKGWFVGDSSGAFRPGDNISRAEFVTVTNRVLRRHILLADIPAAVHTFTDFKATHWAYADFMEAVHSHEFELKADGINETWTKITGTGLDADYNR